WMLEDHDNGWIPDERETNLSDDPERLYYLQDELGSTIRVIGEDGKTSAHYNYDEFGRPLSFKKFDQNWPGPDNTFGYTGYQYDVSSELYYAQARYYMPEIGRFISEDPWNGDLYQPNTLNPYPYVLNNPLKYVDPLGLKQENNWTGCYVGTKNWRKWKDELYYRINNRVSELKNPTEDLVNKIAKEEAKKLQDKYFPLYNSISFPWNKEKKKTLKPLYDIKTDEKSGITKAFLQGFFDGFNTGIWYAASTEPINSKIKKTSDVWKNADLLDELASSGAKYSPDDVLAVTKTVDGKLAWLETGNSKAGMKHILDHADDFANKGIQQSQIKDLVMESLTNGKIVGYQGKGTGRPIYEVMFNGKKYHTAITVGSNGFIVGANPTTLP
uniref:RHS repeat domain-containing protein n=1 Tax=Tepidibacter mesophilus TaxID=655607 RepID=UPI000C06F7C1